LGHSEELISQVIQARRDKVYLATKVGATLDAAGEVIWNSTPAHIFQEVEGSLRRLGTDYIDLYQIHWPDATTPLADTLGAFMRLVEQGKIRHIGVCNFSLAQLQEAVRHAPIASHQLRYNLLERDVETDILPFCREHQIGLLPYGPLGHGLLAGRFQRGDTLSAEDWRSRYPLFQAGTFEKVLDLVDQLAALARRYDRPVGQLALNWLIGQPGITSVLTGARRPAQVDENVGALDWTLTPEDRTEIDRLVAMADLGLRLLPPDEYLEQTKQRGQSG
jgi:aryl-alcohol dehydrogenase-like predicted oxidoreductase